MYSFEGDSDSQLFFFLRSLFISRPNELIFTYVDVFTESHNISTFHENL